MLQDPSNDPVQLDCFGNCGCFWRKQKPLKFILTANFIQLEYILRREKAYFIIANIWLHKKIDIGQSISILLYKTLQ